MRLLILTQKVDKGDDLLGFFHRWILEFARHVDLLTVICLYEGTHTLPSNVRVFSLGKEKRTSKITQIIRFIRYIIRLRNEYDIVFVHMNPEYVVLGGMLWRLFGKRIALWYTHLAVNLKLRIAHALSHVVFSASGYSFKLSSKKLHIVGHGIDTREFACPKRELFKDETVTILSVGSIRQIKNQLVLVDAAALLKERWDKKFRVRIIGGISDEAYGHEVRRRIQEKNVGEVVELVGSVPNTTLPEYYCHADMSINMTPDGGVDKVVLESMAAGVPPIVSNRAFADIFGPYADLLMVAYNDKEALADRIMAVARFRELESLCAYLTKTAQEKFSVENLVTTLVSYLTHK